ncbi:MAG: 3-beta hydroxysteroid dehydrogenase [Silanimonas sp.]|nr:MAG: 3-beta hydroxysteroid dehydrogenase [Silanimonas sp.]
MKVLVTGGGGFLGQALCRALLAEGHEVVSTQRRPSAALAALGIEQRLGDLADAGHARRACEGVEAVFHNAAKAGHWGSEASYVAANVEATRHLLAACREQGIARFVYTSTPSVAHNGRVPCEGGNEVSTPYAPAFKAPYPRTKQAAEKAVLAANGMAVAGGGVLATVALRPRLIWGPGDTNLLPRLVERARAGRLRFIAGGHNRMDTTYVDNAAEAHVLAFRALAPGAACAGRAYFISNGEPLPVREIVNGLLAAAGEPRIEASVPFAVAYAAGALCEALWHTLPLKGEPPMTRFVAEQLATPHWYDLTAARQDFGYVPRVSVEEGLARLARWWRERR